MNLTFFDLTSSCTGNKPRSINSRCSADNVLRKTTFGLNGWSLEMNILSGNRSKNYLIQVQTL